MIPYKRFNGYRPFMYNVSIDACKFLKNPASNLVAKFYYEFLKSYSNINHTCPYYVSSREYLFSLYSNIYMFLFSIPSSWISYQQVLSISS